MALQALKTLTDKQINFLSEYFRNGGNGTQAAMIAYNTNDQNVAAVIAHENLRKPKIVDYLEQTLIAKNDCIETAMSELFAIGYLNKERYKTSDRIKALSKYCDVHLKLAQFVQDKSQKPTSVIAKEREVFVQY